MLKLTFSQAEARVLAHERFHHPHPHVRRKMEALWLKSQGLAHQEIERLAGVSGKTLRKDRISNATSASVPGSDRP
ncbi:MAG: hypothetical protein ABTS16_20120 [Candidatus Accumulibacter phosphatis]|jgi:hypothetical protein|uniref:Transposase n=1 Tax=Candidatus Accumulibacter contiguus TaxID=2954381 RepID=A0ABX1TB84_9PROT|nr:hypothetical protein [Candidatus Accumulibacter contiguus]NMQ06934.1 hypothetical protein [Candidatus Accumulibacter contiguus]HRE87366.1 hypothetical protein [Accumulibacter sp.]HRF13617.1 hypothetical protein [Candidatus Accumulibacter phosphatis]